LPSLFMKWSGVILSSMLISVRRRNTPDARRKSIFLMCVKADQS
jgi:hypothetical protein